MTKRWIECECPVTFVDFDVFEIVSPTTTIDCSECGGQHVIGEIGQALVKLEDGSVIGDPHWLEAD